MSRHTARSTASPLSLQAIGFGGQPGPSRIVLYWARVSVVNAAAMTALRLRVLDFDTGGTYVTEYLADWPTGQTNYTLAVSFGDDGQKFPGSIDIDATATTGGTVTEISAGFDYQ